METWEDRDWDSVSTRKESYNSMCVVNVIANKRLPSEWTHMPRELYVECFYYLSEAALLAVRTCCTVWNKAVREKSLWRKICISRWSHISLENYNSDWFHVYFGGNQKTNKRTFSYTIIGTFNVNLTVGPYEWLIQVDREWAGNLLTITITAINKKTKNTFTTINLSLLHPPPLSFSHKFTTPYKYSATIKKITTFMIMSGSIEVVATNNGCIFDINPLWTELYEKAKHWFCCLQKNVPKKRGKLESALLNFMKGIMSEQWQQSEEKSALLEVIPGIFVDRFLREGLIQICGDELIK